MKIDINRKTIRDLVQMIAGNAICAFAVVCFALPYNMVVSGMSGIGRIINSYTGLGVTAVVTVGNVALFIIGALILGKKFAASIALGTFAFPFFMGIFENIDALQHLVSEPMLAAICAGVLDGVGLGLVLRVGGSTGGIDVPSIILNRKLGWKVATVMSAIDVAIFLLQIPFTEPEGIILGILYALIYSVVLDKMIVMEQGGYQIMIWTDKLPEVNETLLEIGFGTTLIKARGGYMRDEKEVILCASSSRSLNKVKRAVLAIDNRAFITITGMNEINGNGFTYNFVDDVYAPELEDRREGRELK